MANSLSPAFVQIQYHSLYGPHVMTLPTRPWTPDLDYGTYECWDSTTKAADDMIEELILLMVPFFPTSTEFDSFTVYTKATPTGPAIPRVSKANGEAGTAGTPGWSKATEAIWTFKTADGGLAKLDFLDFASQNSFDKVTFAGLSGGPLALVDAFTGDSNAWSGRDDSQPMTFLQISYGLNKALRKRYFMN